MLLTAEEKIGGFLVMVPLCFALHIVSITHFSDASEKIGGFLSLSGGDPVSFLLLQTVSDGFRKDRWLSAAFW